MPQSIKGVPDDQRRQLKKLGESLKPFHGVRGTIPLHYVSTFILVATEEHLNVSTYAQRAGISQSLMTRHLYDLGEVNRYREEGFGLVEGYEDPMDRRNRLMRLSAKGRGVAWQMTQALA